MKKILLIIGCVFLVGVGIAAFIGYRMYNKPHRDISSEPAAFTFTETELAAMFTDNLPTSDQQMKDKVIQVSGSVKSVEQSGNITNITFDEGGSYIISTALDSTETQRIETGNTISIKGLYVGAIEGDSDFNIPGEIKIKNGFVQ